MKGDLIAWFLFFSGKAPRTYASEAPRHPYESPECFNPILYESGK